MLYQGQDPSQSVNRASSLYSTIQQLPPSYEEAISHRNTLRCVSTDYLGDMQEEEDNRHHSFVNVTIVEPLRHSRTDSLPDDDGDKIIVTIGNAIQMQPLAEVSIPIVRSEYLSTTQV